MLRVSSHVFGSSFDMFSGLSVFFVIGYRDYLGFMFYDTHLKASLRLTDIAFD